MQVAEFTELSFIPCFSYCCKKWGIPLFCSEYKFQLFLFRVRFTSIFSPNFCFIFIIIPFKMRYCCFSSSVSSTCHCYNVRIVALHTFVSEQKECFNLLSNDEKCSFSTNIRMAMEVQICLAEFFPSWLQCHMSVYYSTELCFAVN